MKKNTDTAFVTMLNTLHEAGITTKAALMEHPRLYKEVWLATERFAHFALLSKTGKNAQGETLPGNAGKIDVLERRGVAERADIELDCTLKIMDRLDRVLSQPLEKQRNYSYTICNNSVNDFFRITPKEITFVPLNGMIPGSNDDHSCTYGDVIPDYTYDPGHVLAERETIRELTEMLRVKRARELAEEKAKEIQERSEQKALILRELPKLSAHAPEAFARLGRKYLNLKTGELASMIITAGYEHSFDQVMYDTSAKYDIPLTDIRNILPSAKPVKKDKGLVRLLSGRYEDVTDQLSKYTNRAKGRVKEQPETSPDHKKR